MSMDLRYQRHELVDQAFKERVAAGRFPSSRGNMALGDTSLAPYQLVEMFESQVESRLMDIRARQLKNQNKVFYTIGSSGHEGNVVLGEAFRPDDMAFLHYRSGAFVLQRSKKKSGVTGLYDLALSLAASVEDPISGGRHKVWGSRELMIPPQTSTIASHLPKAVGVAMSIARARDLQVDSILAPDGVVVCSFGDASANHATALSALNTAAWIAYKGFPMPIVFVCEDNGVGISVPTPEDWIRNNFSNRPGLRYFEADGCDILDSFQVSALAENYVRKRRKPAFFRLKTVRLLGHAGSDPEWNYHSFSQIESREADDPILHSARILVENGILSTDDILSIYLNTTQRVHFVTEEACARPKLDQIQEVKKTLTACAETRSDRPLPTQAQRDEVFGKEKVKQELQQPMAKLINLALTDILLQHPNTLVFGEDVAKKGGVYNVTSGLQKQFGARRVFNSPLDETSILGTAIGLGHNGFLPIPEIQFLAYVHNAEDQIRGEAATLAFFSKGQFTNPMVIRIAGLAYQKGFGGHFHNDNSLTVFRDIPGILLVVPSNGADAVRLLRAAVREAYTCGRVVIFIEPIALYNTRDLYEPGDKQWSFSYPSLEEISSVGEIKEYGRQDPSELTILTYGNGVSLSLQAMKRLENDRGLSVRVLDLQWLVPLHWNEIAPKLQSVKKLLIVDECRKTGSLSEELVTGLVERGLIKHMDVQVHAAEDCFIPLGVAAAAGLPSVESIYHAALELAGGGPQ